MSQRKAAYKIKEVNGFWRFHVYKKTWRGWKRIAGVDRMENAEERIHESAAAKGGILYDEEGVRI